METEDQTSTTALKKRVNLLSWCKKKELEEPHQWMRTPLQHSVGEKKKKDKVLGDRSV